MNEKKKKLWIRITAIVLAALMAGGTIYATISFLLLSMA